MKLIYKNQTQATRETGITYIGNINHSTKHEKAYGYNELTYTIYLSPANSSGYEVCPLRTPECTLLCLHESGMNRINVQGMINNSRAKKTRMFFENREFLVRWIIDEIKSGIKKAEKLGFGFSVRLNNTSDISPESFYITENGSKKNLLQIFPSVKFYDYTKIPKRAELLKKYPNYDLTFSYSGSNMESCKTMLESGVRVAMVFKNVPETYMGYQVVDGDLYDLRYKDQKDVIVGLKFKKVRTKLTANSFVIGS